MKLAKLLLIVFLPALSVAQTGAFSLKGKTGYSATAAAYLSYKNDAGDDVQDTSFVKNGSFEFKGKIGGPVMAMLMVNTSGKALATVQIGDAKSLYLEAGKNIVISSPDSLAHATITGSGLNDDFMRFKTATKPAVDKMQAIMHEFYSAPKETRESNTYRDEVQKRYGVFEQEYQVAQLAFIKENPKTLVSLDALISYTKMVPDSKETLSLFNGLDVKVKDSVAGKAFAAEIMK